MTRYHGSSWNPVWENLDTVEDSEWTNTSYDISAVADGQSTVYVRYEIGLSDTAWEYCGWNIDDFMITGKLSGSSLDHIWAIDVPSGESPYEFSVEAFRPDSPDADDFVFSYSEDSFVYTDMVVVNSPVESVYNYGLPPTLSGTVYIRVKDTERTVGNTDISGLSIDELFITSTKSSQFTMGYDHYLTPSYVEPVFTFNPDDEPVVTLLTPDPMLTDQILSGTPYFITWTATDTEDSTAVELGIALGAIRQDGYTAIRQDGSTVGQFIYFRNSTRLLMKAARAPEARCWDSASRVFGLPERKPRRPGLSEIPGVTT